MKESTAVDLATDDWLRIVEQAVEYRTKTGVAPQFILWGGEPLASPAFSSVSTALRDNGFTTALITNGVLLEKHAADVNRNIDTLYVSLDGPAEIHEKLRGARGIFQKIGRGLAALDSARILRVCLFTLCGDNLHVAAGFPHQLATMGFDRVIFQNLIYCTSGQATDYRHWMKNSFGQEAPRLGSWISDTVEPWVEDLPEVVERLHSAAEAGLYPIGVDLCPGELRTSNVVQWYDSSVHLKKDRSPCLMPFHHLQINHDGNAHFCVDFNDFTLGNVREHSISELFHSGRADRFRAEGPACNSLCSRCPWYYNESLSIDRSPCKSPQNFQTL